MEYNRTIQNEIEDYLDQFNIGESLIDGRPQLLGSYNSGINFNNLNIAIDSLVKEYSIQDIKITALGLIEDSYASPNYKILGNILLRKIEQHV